MTESLVACDIAKLTGLLNDALAANIPAPDILNNGHIASMDTVGKKMVSVDMFIPKY